MDTFLNLINYVGFNYWLKARQVTLTAYWSSLLVLDNLYDCICQMVIFRLNFLFVSVLMSIIYYQVDRDFYIDIDIYRSSILLG